MWPICVCVRDLAALSYTVSCTAVLTANAIFLLVDRSFFWATDN